MLEYLASQNIKQETSLAKRVYKPRTSLFVYPIIFCVTICLIHCPSADNGEIRFLGSLDHETEPFYTLVVTAEDLDGLTANATVNIVVTDVNDNPPVFSREQYNFEVLENLPNGKQGQFVSALVTFQLRMVKTKQTN